MWDRSTSCAIPTPELVSAPAGEPVSLTELKLHVRQDLDDDDDLLESYGTAAREWFEDALDRRLVTSTWKVRYPYFPGWAIELPYPPLQSVTSIEYKDLGLATQTLSTTYYDVVTWRTPGGVQLKNGYAWPATGITPDAVTITFVAGYGKASAVPQRIKAGIKLLVEHWYAYREPVIEGQVMSLPFSIDSIVQQCRGYRF